MSAKHGLVLGLLGIWLVAALLAEPATPAAVSPTIHAWRQRGLSCSAPVRDAVPSGLLQWSCRVIVSGTPLDVLLDGDELGVFQILMQVPAKTEPSTARAVFNGLVDDTPAVRERAKELEAWILGSNVSDRTLTIGTLWARLARDPLWTTFVVMPGPRHSVNDPVGSST